MQDLALNPVCGNQGAVLMWFQWIQLPLGKRLFTSSWGAALASGPYIDS